MSDPTILLMSYSTTSLRPPVPSHAIAGRLRCYVCMYARSHWEASMSNMTAFVQYIHGGLRCLRVCVSRQSDDHTPSRKYVNSLCFFSKLGHLEPRHSLERHQHRCYGSTRVYHVGTCTAIYQTAAPSSHLPSGRAVNIDSGVPDPPALAYQPSKAVVSDTTAQLSHRRTPASMPSSAGRS